MNTGDHLAKDSDELFNDLSDSEDESGSQDLAEENGEQNRFLKPTYSSLNKVCNFKPISFYFPSLIKTRQNGQLLITDKATAPSSSHQLAAG